MFDPTTVALMTEGAKLTFTTAQWAVTVAYDATTEDGDVLAPLGLTMRDLTNEGVEHYRDATCAICGAAVASHRRAHNWELGEWSAPDPQALVGLLVIHHDPDTGIATDAEVADDLGGILYDWYGRTLLKELDLNTAMTVGDGLVGLYRTCAKRAQAGDNELIRHALGALNCLYGDLVYSVRVAFYDDEGVTGNFASAYGLLGDERVVDFVSAVTNVDNDTIWDLLDTAEQQILRGHPEAR